MILCKTCTQSKKSINAFGGRLTLTFPVCFENLQRFKLQDFKLKANKMVDFFFLNHKVTLRKNFDFKVSVRQINLFFY